MKDILNKQKTVVISSLDNEGNPRVSYAPYVFINSKFYIYISETAEHYNNILENSKVSIMAVEDEKDAKMTFLRARVTFEGIGKLKKDSEEILEVFAEVHGRKVMEMLKKLDFDVFEIESTKGRLVKGFGQAFDLELINNEWIEIQVVIDKSHSRG